MDAVKPAVRAILYDAAGHDREVRIDQVDVGSLSDDQLLWIDLTGAETSDLPQVMQSAINWMDDSCRLEIFDNYYRFCVQSRDGSGVLRFAVGHSWVLTKSDQRPEFFQHFIETDQGETLKGKLTPTAFAASLLMRHFDGFREEIAKVDLAVDGLDDTILRGSEKRSLLSALVVLRRRLAHLRGTLIDQRRLVHGLIAPDFLAHVTEADRDFLVEINRIYERLEDDIARARETVIGSFELYASRVAQDTNQLIKVLTIATVITGVIGAVAGIFGMNFNTPIPSLGLQGFLVVTGAMIVVSIGIVVLALWRRWV